MGPVTVFLRSDVLRLATRAYMLFGCARCLTSTFGSLYFILARVTTVSIWAPSKIIILDGAQTWQSHHLFSFWRFTTWNGGLLVVAMALFGNKSVPRTWGSIEFFLLQVNTIWTPMKKCNFGWGPNFLKSPSSLVPMFYDFQRKLTCCPDTKMPHQNSRLDILG